MKKRIEVSGYITKNIRTGFHGSFYVDEASAFKNIDNGWTVVPVSGFTEIEIPEQEIKITESQFDEAYQRCLKIMRYTVSPLDLKKELGFKND